MLLKAFKFCAHTCMFTLPDNIDADYGELVIKQYIQQIKERLGILYYREADDAIIRMIAYAMAVFDINVLNYPHLFFIELDAFVQTDLYSSLIHCLKHNLLYKPSIKRTLQQLRDTFIKENYYDDSCPSPAGEISFDLWS